ncbi:MAG: ArnT family glycosyltransferase, partial [Pyrinomonadaceae bacterium]
MNDSLNQDQLGVAAISFGPWRLASDAWRWTRGYAAELLCAFFLAAMSLNILTVITRKSITLDETVMIPSAYYHLAAGNFQLVHDHPPLSKIVAAIPLLFIQPAELQPSQAGAPNSSEAEYAFQRRFWEDNRAEFELISFWSRAAMMCLTAGLGILIFIFARDLLGPRAAVLAVALFSIEPTVLAHGRVVQTDVPAAFGFLLTCFALDRYLRKRTWKRAAWLGVACGLSFLAKFSMLIIAPLLVLVLAFLVWQNWRLGHEVKVLVIHSAAVILATLIVVHSAYYFHSRDLTIIDTQWIADSFPNRAPEVLAAVRMLSYLLPTDFVLGVFWQLWHSGEGHPAGLLGMYSMKGWWYYFPVAFALKTTLPFLVLSLCSLAWATYQTIKRRDRRFLILLIPFAVYTVFVMLSPINIGIRYYLPAYSFLFILSGAMLADLLSVTRGKRWKGLAVIVAVLGWAGYEAIRAYPNQMSYMNQLASARPHWWYLSDSNVEWGDDIKDLATYLRARGET